MPLPTTTYIRLPGGCPRPFETTRQGESIETTRQGESIAALVGVRT